MTSQPHLILASASPRRLALLAQMGVVPAEVLAGEVDETPAKHEWPRTLASRLALAKAQAVAAQVATRPNAPQTLILAADTVVAVGRRILPKAERLEEARLSLGLLSGRSHAVYTGLCLITPNGRVRQKLVVSKLRFKRFSNEDVESYLASGEWRGKAGGYAIQGLAGAFVLRLIGSYPNVVGLPLYETMALLEGEGYPVKAGWLAAGQI